MEITDDYKAVTQNIAQEYTEEHRKTQDPDPSFALLATKKLVASVCKKSRQEAHNGCHVSQKKDHRPCDGPQKST